MASIWCCPFVGAHLLAIAAVDVWIERMKNLQQPRPDLLWLSIGEPANDLVVIVRRFVEKRQVGERKDQLENYGKR